MSLTKLLMVVFGSMIGFILLVLVGYKLIINKTDNTASQQIKDQQHQEANARNDKAADDQRTKDIVSSQLATRDQQLSDAKKENEQLKNTVNQIASISDSNNKIFMKKFSALETRVNDLEKLLKVATTRSQELNVVHLDKLEKSRDSKQSFIQQRKLLKDLRIISIVGDRAWITENGAERSVTTGDVISSAKKGNQLQIVEINADEHTITVK